MALYIYGHSIINTIKAAPSPGRCVECNLGVPNCTAMHLPPSLLPTFTEAQILTMRADLHRLACRHVLTRLPSSRCGIKYSLKVVIPDRLSCHGGSRDPRRKVELRASTRTGW